MSEEEVEIVEVEVQRREGLYGFEFLEPDQRRAGSVEERKTYEVKQMWQLTHEIVNLAVRGFKYVEIASILNVTPATVSNTLNSTLGMRKLSELRQARDEEASVVAEKIRILTDKALNAYMELLDEDNMGIDPELRRTAAKDVVNDLSGLKVPTRIQSHHVSTALTAEELSRFKERGLKAAKQSGLLVDIGGNGDGEEE